MDWYKSGYEAAREACRNNPGEITLLNQNVDVIENEGTRQWLDGVIKGAEEERRKVKGIRLESPQFDSLGEVDLPPNGGTYRGIRTVLVEFQIPARAEVVIEKAGPNVAG